MTDNINYTLDSLKIDEEFQDMIPPLTPEERQTLEETILSDGRVYFPLIVWDGTIIDGHNRYEILKAHPHLEYEIQEKSFENRDEALVWICKNQLGRRNLSEFQKLMLIGRQYEAEKSSRGGYRDMEHDENGQFTAKGQSEPLRQENTSKRIAEENHVSPSYVKRAAQFVRGLDIAEENVPGISSKIMSGEITPSVKDVASIAKAKPWYQRTISEQIAMDKPKKRRNKENAEIDAIYEELLKPKKVTEEDTLVSIRGAVKSMIGVNSTLFEHFPRLLTEKEHLTQVVGIMQEAKDFIADLEKRLEDMSN